MGHKGWGGVCHAGVGWVMQVWDGVCHAGVGGSCRGGVGYAEVGLMVEKIDVTPTLARCRMMPIVVI